MKQLLLSGKGTVSLQETPLPGRLPGSILVRNRYSVISSGTEASAVSRSAGWFGVVEKLCQSGDKIHKVWNLVKQHGVRTAWQTVRSRLEDFTPLGYSSCGVVVETDELGSEFRPGDWVACMGTGFANHAEYVVVPSNLAVKLLEGVLAEEASFAALACIAMQGVRSLDLSPGEQVAVIGLGLIGSLSAVLARAMGYSVCGIDLAATRAEYCRENLGIPAWCLDSDVRSAIRQFTDGRGIDGVVLAAATSSSDPVNLAFDLCRQRGSVSVVGNVGLELERAKMYRKEIRLRMSCSYGPGRYDDEYEVEGHDYPLAHARWTERRNLECCLGMIADRRVDLRPLISRKLSIDSGSEAYSLVKQSDPELYGVLFDYGEVEEAQKSVDRSAYVLHTNTKPNTFSSDRVRIGVIGCGGFAKDVHLPNLVALVRQFEIRAVASQSGVSAAVVARRFKIPVATSDFRVLLDDPEIDAVLICTRHKTHASLTLAALEAGKHVFVEKPLCFTVAEGNQIEELARIKRLVVRIGFNRRFAPQLVSMRDAIPQHVPKLFTCRVCVSGTQADHWSNDAEEGGRFLGEGVHFLDLCNWFVRSAPKSVSAHYLGHPSPTNPNAIVTISYPDGSTGNVIYTTSGHTGVGKEYYEAHGGGISARCDNFSKLELAGTSPRASRRPSKDKGHVAELEEFYQCVFNANGCCSGADARAGTVATWMAVASLQSARNGRTESWLPIDEKTTISKVG